MFKIFLLGLFVIMLLFLMACSTPLVICPEDAKICLDGTVVVREGPDCEFAECNVKVVDCTNESRKAEICFELYEPVCGWSNENIKCITYPCAQTYSNSCFACQNENVAYYTFGECANG